VRLVVPPDLPAFPTRRSSDLEPLDILELEAGGGHCVPRDLARELLGRAVPDLVLVHLAVSAAQPSRAHHPPPEISDHIAHLREERCPRPLCRRPDRHAWVELPRPAEIFVFRLPAASLRCGERGDEPVLQRRHRYLTRRRALGPRVR